MNDLVRVLRGQRIDGRGADEIMRRAADEIERLRSRLAEAEKARDQYKKIVDRYCQRHDFRSCACEFGDESDDPISQCNYHLDLSKRLAEAEALLRKAYDSVVMDYEHYRLPEAEVLRRRIDAFLNKEKT